MRNGRQVLPPVVILLLFLPLVSCFLASHPLVPLLLELLLEFLRGLWFKSAHLVLHFLELSLLALVLPALALSVSFFSDLSLRTQTLTVRDE